MLSILGRSFYQGEGDKGDGVTKKNGVFKRGDSPMIGRYIHIITNSPSLGKGGGYKGRVAK
jgi:hypothetical protein